MMWTFAIGVGLVLILFSYGRAACNTAITEGLARMLGTCAAIAFVWFILWLMAH
jgi:hypothetical protein